MTDVTVPFCTSEVRLHGSLTLAGYSSAMVLVMYVGGGWGGWGWGGGGAVSMLPYFLEHFNNVFLTVLVSTA